LLLGNGIPAAADKRTIMNDPVTVWEWSAEDFHRKVFDLQNRGYIARLETYQVKAEMNPETGFIVHLHTIELLPPEKPAKTS
jgi:hypothetical protein